MPRIKNTKTIPIMPPVNAYASRSDWEVACWRRIMESRELLESLITSHERHNLVLRAAARDRLSLGKSYRKIVEELWLSPQTVSSLKKAITEKSYRSYRARNERKKKIYSTRAKPRRSRQSGIPRRTKYGVLYL